MADFNRQKGVLYSATGVAYVPPKIVESAGKDGWYIVYWVTDVQAGKLVRKRKYGIALGETLREKRRSAQDHARRIAQFLAKGATVGEAPLEQARLTVLRGYELAEAIKRAEAQQEGKPAHYLHRAGVFHAWIEEAGLAARPLDAFERKHVHEFLDWLTQVRGVKARTKNNYLDYVRMASNVLIDRGHLDRNPCQGIRRLRTESKRHVPFTTDEQAALEIWMQRHDPELYRFTRFIYYGFIRRVEILRLTVGQVDLENGIILLWSGKTKNKRQLPVVITPGLRLVIEEMLRDRPPATWYLFGRDLVPSPHNLHPNRVSERHRAALEACQIDTSTHDLYGWKHTGVCAAYRAGIDIYSIMRQCRHSNLAETETYLRAMGLRISPELKTAEW